MERKRIAFIVLLVIVIGLGSYGLYFWYRWDKPLVIKPLPDPFEFNNGTRVETVEEWQVRRQEIKDTLLEIEYGHMPGRPDALKAKIIDSEEREDGSTLNTLKLTIIPSNSSPEDKFSFTVWQYVPEGDGPFPTVVKVAADGTGSQTEVNPLMMERGYMYVCYNHTALDPDTMGYDVEGPCQEAYPKYDWGSIAVWAWGAMRVADFVLAEPWVEYSDDLPNVDPNVLIITGHSRRGKTALLAGAMDERFTMVVPNGSGCGGAGSFLIQGYFAETIAEITSKELYRSWFHEDFDEYAHNEVELTFDQHFLRALVAPRVIISTEAYGDLWANPTGTQAIYEATLPVFEFLDAEKKNGLHYRHGFHAFTEEDFEVFLDFADKMLLDKEVSGDFYMTPYDLDIPLDYDAPE